MSKEERKEQIETIAERFIGLDAESKARIVGYMDGVKDERAKWEKGKKQEVAIGTV